MIIEKTMRKYKLIAFDIDGTIIDNIASIWMKIHTHLEVDADKIKHHRKQFFDKKISYIDWVRLDVKLWKSLGKKKKDIMSAFHDIKLMKNTKPVLLELKKRGYILVVISGSFNFAIEKVLPDYKKIFGKILINKLYFDKKGNISRLVPTMYDMEHKLTGLKKICKSYGIKLNETIFIGDNYNDVFIAEKAGLSIAFCPSSKELEKISSAVVKKKDVKEILKYIPQD